MRAPLRNSFRRFFLFPHPREDDVQTGLFLCSFFIVHYGESKWRISVRFSKHHNDEYKDNGECNGQGKIALHEGCSRTGRFQCECAQAAWYRSCGSMCTTQHFASTNIWKTKSSFQLAQSASKTLSTYCCT